MIFKYPGILLIWSFTAQGPEINVWLIGDTEPKRLGIIRLGDVRKHVPHLDREDLEALRILVETRALEKAQRALDRDGDLDPTYLHIGPPWCLLLIEQAWDGWVFISLELAMSGGYTHKVKVTVDPFTPTNSLNEFLRLNGLAYSVDSTPPGVSYSSLPPHLE